jgi:hypothetical protein
MPNLMHILVLSAVFWNRWQAQPAPAASTEREQMLLATYMLRQTIFDWFKDQLWGTQV